MLVRPPLNGFKAHTHTNGGWVNFWKNAGAGGYHMMQPTLTITRLIKVSVTLSFTNSRIKGAVTNLLNHVDILWRWEHLPETFPYQYLLFQLFFGQKRVTHAHMPLAPPPPSSFLSVTATLEPLVDHSCSGSQWMQLIITIHIPVWGESQTEDCRASTTVPSKHITDNIRCQSCSGRTFRWKEQSECKR